MRYTQEKVCLKRHEPTIDSTTLCHISRVTLQPCWLKGYAADMTERSWIDSCEKTNIFEYCPALIGRSLRTRCECVASLRDRTPRQWFRLQLALCV